VKKLALLAALTMLWCFGTSAQQLTPDQKRTLELKPGVVLVVVQYTVTWRLLQPVEISYRETGTGFIYRPDGYIITNGHVVADAHLKDPDARAAFDARARKEFQDALDDGTIIRKVEEQYGKRLTEKQKEVVRQQLKPDISFTTPTLDVYLANGKSYTAKILQWDNPIGEGKDVAILKIAGSDLPTVSLGDSDKVNIQDPVMVIGFPGVASKWGRNSLISQESNFDASATNGHISAIKKSNIDTPLFQSDAAITHGNSGGPVFNSQGKVIGIATAGADATQGFNWFVPINTAMEFVREAGATPESGPFNPIWASALDLYDAGKCKASIPEFDNALDMMPGLPDASQYRNMASKCWESKNGFQQFMETSAWAVYAAVGVVVLALIVIVLMQRKSGGSIAVAVPAGAAAHVHIDVAPSAGALPGGPAQGQSFGNIQAMAGELSGKTFKVTKEGLLIGRSPKCQVVLQDDTVSSEHAWIVPVGNEVVVIDKGSSNGTYVNSVDSPKVSKIGLRNGDRIYLGKKGTVVFTYFTS
jgi:serine protease Do